ncbi:MAG: ribosome biogenesis GTPase Der [Gracilibacteraceae bacterium]|jgi:GTP-binding protein|nr:ribosome biogenesis GTPase Der [Gracilibacteraceae bacterium]
MAKPVVAIVGRPNVGKSTLFNRLTGGLTAIVEDTPGVTRDRLYRDADWRGRKFTLIDTGGIEPQTGGAPLAELTRRQAELAAAEADLTLLLLDGQSGPTETDERIARFLRRGGKPVLLVVNKVENFSNFANEAHEYLRFGLGPPLPVSAAHGLNSGDLLDAILTALPAGGDEDGDPDIVRVAIVGRPNVGKSSLVNKLLGAERVIVSDIPGTTRDAVDTPFVWGDRHYTLIDTAGIRRKTKISLPTENYSVIRALRAINRCDVALMLLDAAEGATEQDKRIAGYVHEAGKGIILVVNKWDLVEKDSNTMNAVEKKLREEMGFLHYAPTWFISALTGQRVHKIMELTEFVAEQNCRRVQTSVLNGELREWLYMNPPPGDRGKRLKIYYATQQGVRPPTFVFFVNDPDILHFSYKRYLENQLRGAFGFEGAPIRMIIRKREEPV